MNKNMIVEKRYLWLLIALACMLVVISLAGCGASSPSPSETTDTFLKGIQTGDDEMVNSVYAPGDFKISDAIESEGDDTGTFDENEEMYKALAGKMREFEYELSDEQIKGDKATVTVKIRTYPLGSVMTDFISDYMSQALVLAFSDTSEEKLEKLATTIFTEKMNALSDKSYQKDATLTLTKEDNVWKVDDISKNDEFINALSGNLISAMEQLEEAFSEDKDE